MGRQLPAQLAHGLHERQRFNVANAAANFGYYYIELAPLTQQQHAALNFVGDVGHHLHRFAQERALALAPDYGVVDAAGGHVVGLRGGRVQEALVVAQVEVGFGAVVGHIAFAVLIGVERAGVDIYIRVKFLNRDAEPSGLQKLGQRGGNNSFTE